MRDDQPRDAVSPAARPVVWISHKLEERCTACGSAIYKGSFIQIDRQHGLRCPACAGLADLVYLPSGDPALTRRAVAASHRSAIVVQFSRSRGRNERRGALVEEAALELARQQCERDAIRRRAQATRRQGKMEGEDQAYTARFTQRIIELFPGCPQAEALTIAQRACERHSGRVGRSAAAKALDERAVTLAVRAHIRHSQTDYDHLLARGLEPSDARPRVTAQIEARLAAWRGNPRPQP
jgi:hypothetical protein